MPRLKKVIKKVAKKATRRPRKSKKVEGQELVETGSNVKLIVNGQVKKVYRSREEAEGDLA